ncbi:hypothetical protein FHR23_000517 [Stakelama sediminis]|uniref:DUF1318 domain-containing protein n=1 Tax=Stakelama sediminis TaxID=463200 RepID=A0A840YVM4_9SPHN|nr:YdbL family protein [Stakelama sediminis]MBB5717610.1 hypothetical protein [Stakelama sediminis]
MMTKKMLMALGAVAMLGGVASAAYAQRDPAYSAAKAKGLVGEQPDGYLGIVGSATPELRKMVNNINIQRKAVYTQKAQATGSTVEQMAFTTGCNLIANLSAGEKYQTPSGQWKTMTSAPPERDARCV